MVKSLFDKKIIVIGAGVVGLSVALNLKQKGYKNVIVVAKYIPGDMSIEYTSPFAGAHWRTMAKNDDSLLTSFDRITYQKFIELSKTKSKETGIVTAPSYDYYYDSNQPEVSDPWFKDLVPDFKFIKDKSVLPEGATLGHTYTTVLINSPVYLKWLASSIESLGGKIIRGSFSDIHKVFDLIEEAGNAAVINCTGLGASFLGGVEDSKVFPTRGQTIIVKAPHVKKTITFMGESYMSYVIPRSDGTVVLGGTADKNSFNPFADPGTNKKIMERTIGLCPELVKDGPLQVVRYSTGLRPTRLGGPRIENEIFISPKDKNHTVQVTHAYGHGGFGFQSSWGSAEHTIAVMEKGFVSNGKYISSI